MVVRSLKTLLFPLNFAFPRKTFRWLWVPSFLGEISFARETLRSLTKLYFMLQDFSIHPKKIIFLFSPKTLHYISIPYFLAKPLHSQSSSPRNFAFSVKSLCVAFHWENVPFIVKHLCEMINYISEFLWNTILLREKHCFLLQMFALLRDTLRYISMR